MAFNHEYGHGVQNELGMTALMYAVKDNSLFSIADEIIKTNGKHLNIGDNNGNTALFHAAHNHETFNNILKYKDYFDVNHLNNRNENLILFCARNKRIVLKEYIGTFETLTKFNCKDPNITNTLGKTAAMYLAEFNKFKELKEFMKYYNIDPNYRSQYGNTLVSAFVQGYKNYSMERIRDKGFGLNKDPYKRYAFILKYLVEIGCNFNVPVDESGNNIITILKKLKDNISSQYLLEKGCFDYLVENQKDSSYEKYYIDESDPVIAENNKSVQLWLREVYYPEGTINTHIVGVLLHGHNANSFF